MYTTQCKKQTGKGCDAVEKAWGKTLLKNVRTLGVSKEIKKSFLAGKCMPLAT